MRRRPIMAALEVAMAAYGLAGRNPGYVDDEEPSAETLPRAPSSAKPHANKREIERRLRQAARQAAKQRGDA